MTLSGVGPSRSADTFAYDAGTRTLTVAFIDVAEGVYALDLASSATGFRDAVGNLLDGNADGTPGDPHSKSFTVETTMRPWTTPLEMIGPPGSLIYHAIETGSFGAAGDSDTFSVVLDAGQTTTVLLQPLDASIQARVELVGPNGAALGGAEAAAEDETVLLQTMPAAHSGTYSIRLLSLAGSGPYEVQLLLNAHLEVETYGGIANDRLTSAEDLASSSIALDDSIANRLAVFGQTDSALASTPDWFKFQLAAGQFATLALTAPPGATLQLQLRDAADALLVEGQTDAVNVGRYITTFSAPRRASTTCRSVARRTRSTRC